MSIIKYNNFKVSHISILDNNLLYNNEKLYLLTPIVNIVDIIEINKKVYLQLGFKKNIKSTYFVNNILSIEQVIKSKINKDSLIINSQLIQDMTENIFMKVKVTTTNNNIFDKKKNLVPFTSLNKNDQVKCILHVTNLYIDTKNSTFGYSLELNQLMVL